MIQVKIRQEAERRGIKTPYRLAVEFGFSQDLAARLWKGEKLPKLETLDKICSKWRCPLDTLVTFAAGTTVRKRRNGSKGR